MWIGQPELTCGRLDGSWITGTERKHFHIFFHPSITIGMVVIVLISNRGSISKLYFKQKFES